MQVLGLTGSIAMGKTSTAQALGRLGLPIHDADSCVHRLFDIGGHAVTPISDMFPMAVRNGAVDRVQLGACVFSKPNALKQLEGIVHPLVRAERDKFLETHRRRRAKLVVLDVPLLYETGGQNICNAVMVVSAPAFLQRRRALNRPDMTPEKFASILARQMPDHEKRKRADVVIMTGLGFADTYRRIIRYIGRR